MNKKLKDLIMEKVVRENMNIGDTIEYVWDLKQELKENRSGK